jgi:DNA-binding SARP family transcriptional activator/Tol biopolymer transport system component
VTGSAVQPRRLAVLAVIAAAGTRGVSRERLLALLWTDTDEERARKALNQALYALRHEIGSDDVITGVRDLVIAPELLSSDIAEFRMSKVAGNFERAVAVYQGPFLDGFHLTDLPEFERWLELERATLARDYATCLERLANRAQEAGDHGSAVTWWRRLAAIDPLDVKTTLQLMEALVRAGDQVGALKHARVHEVLLAEQLELPPNPEVVALAERIRKRPPAAPAKTADAPKEVPGQTAPPKESPAVVLPAPSPQIDTWPGVERRAAPAAPPRRALPTSLWLLGGAAALIVIALAAAQAFWSDAVPALEAARKVTFDTGLELDPMLSPDGQSIVYAAGPEGAMRIFVRRVDGGRAVRVSGELFGDHRRPRWSPDGSRLLFQTNGSIWLVPALGGPPRPVVVAPDGGRALYPDWSPGGDSLVWVQSDSIVVRALSGGTVRFVATLPEAHSLAWSPDGRWIAAVSRNEGFGYGAGASRMQVGIISVGNLAPSSVWLIPASGGTPLRVAGGDQLHVSPEWLGNDRLIFVSNRDGARDVFMTVLDGSGKPGPFTRLTTGVNAHGVSVQRNGRAIAYSVFTQSSNVWALPIPEGASVGTSPPQSPSPAVRRSSRDSMSRRMDGGSHSMPMVAAVRTSIVCHSPAARWRRWWRVRTTISGRTGVRTAALFCTIAL